MTPFACVAAVTAALALALALAITSPAERGRAKAGLVLNHIVIVLASLRLSLGETDLSGLC